MSSNPSFEPSVLLLAQLLAGFAAGLVYFEALRRTVMRLMARRGWFEPVALTASRISIAVAAFAIAARVGAAALLVMLVAFLIARTVAVHRARRAV